MGKIWGVGVVAAVVVAAITASSAPVAQAGDDAKASKFVPSYALPASLAEANAAGAPHSEPDALVSRWSCDLPMHIFYAGAPDVDSRDILKQLEYPVAYLRALGRDVSIIREVAYRPDYTAPTNPGDVLIIVPTSDADKAEVGSGSWAVAEFTPTGGRIEAAKITVDGLGGLSSDILLHELGHVVGLPHKEGAVMATSATSSVAFDAGETAAIDCR